jgi:hypothetical protein
VEAEAEVRPDDCDGLVGSESVLRGEVVADDSRARVGWAVGPLLEGWRPRMVAPSATFDDLSMAAVSEWAREDSKLKAPPDPHATSVGYRGKGCSIRGGLRVMMAGTACRRSCGRDRTASANRRDLALPLFPSDETVVTDMPSCRAVVQECAREAFVWVEERNEESRGIPVAAECRTMTKRDAWNLQMVDVGC